MGKTPISLSESDVIFFKKKMKDNKYLQNSMAG